MYVVYVMQGDFWRWAQLSLLRPSSDNLINIDQQNQSEPIVQKEGMHWLHCQRFRNRQFVRAGCFRSFLYPVDSNSGKPSLRTARINLEFASNRTLLRRMHIDTRRYKKIQEDTRRYKKIQDDTRRYKMIQGDTRRYKKIQEDTRRYKKIQEDTRRYKKIQEDTR